MKENKINNLLVTIGFSKTEIVVYLMLLKQGESNANEIAYRTGLHRPNVYDAISRLKKKGIIEILKKEKGSLFLAKKPEWLLEHFNQLQRDLKEMLPMMDQIIEKKKEKEEVSILYGNLALRNLIFESLNSKSEILVLGVPNSAHPLLGDAVMEEYHTERIKKQIPLKLIYFTQNTNMIDTLNKMPLTEARHFKQDNNSDTSISISDDCIFYVIYKEPITIIKISPLEITNYMKSHFQKIWNLTPR